MKPIARVNFAVWNTKLAPPHVTPRENPELATMVRTAMRQLLVQERCALVALSEVRRLDMLQWLPSELRNGWGCVRQLNKAKNDSDLALLFNNDLITVREHAFISDYHKSSVVRCGLLAVLELPDGTPLILALAHWRSDVGNRQVARGKRVRAAESLRNAIADALARFGAEAPVMILGDLNVEPYDDLFETLPADRTRENVRRSKPKKPGDLLFYNAAWRWLGESSPWSGSRAISIAGTSCNSGGGSRANWRTIDHVLVSGSLVGEMGWTLLETETAVWTSEEVFDAARCMPRPPLDHLPIVGGLVNLIGEDG